MWQKYPNRTSLCNRLMNYFVCVIIVYNRKKIILLSCTCLYRIQEP